MVPGRAGALADNGLHDVVSLINDQPQAAQVVEVTVDTAANDTLYSVTINTVDVEITSDASATKPEIADALADAINAEPLISGHVLAASDGVDQVDITSRTPGDGFTFSETDANLSSATPTANATADAVIMGRGVVQDSASSQFAQLADAGNMIAQAIVLTPVVVNSTDYTVAVITAEGVRFEETITSDGSATAQEIVEALEAALNAALPADSVIVTEDNVTLTLTSELAGRPFSAEYSESLLATTSSNAANALTDVNAALEGVALFDYAFEVPNEDTAEYPGSSVMSVLKRGRVNVATEAAVQVGDLVYIRVAADGALDAIGGWAQAAGSGLVRITKATWRKQLTAALAVLDFRA
jgi:hypothetical protein